jgi:hypothetical protein
MLRTRCTITAPERSVFPLDHVPLNCEMESLIFGSNIDGDAMS